MLHASCSVNIYFPRIWGRMEWMPGFERRMGVAGSSSQQACLHSLWFPRQGTCFSALGAPEAPTTQRAQGKASPGGHVGQRGAEPGGRPAAQIKMPAAVRLCSRPAVQSWELARAGRPPCRSQPRAAPRQGLNSLLWGRSQIHTSWLQREDNRSESPGLYRTRGPAQPCWRWEHFNLYELYSFILHTSYLGLWEEDAPIKCEGHDVAGDDASVLFRLEGHDYLVVSVGDELEG